MPRFLSTEFVADRMKCLYIVADFPKMVALTTARGGTRANKRIF